jgi:hypothetical protein
MSVYASSDSGQRALFDQYLAGAHPAVAAAGVTQGGLNERQAPEMEAKQEQRNIEWAKSVNAEVDKRIGAIGISDFGRDPEYRKDPVKYKLELAKRIRSEVLADPSFQKPASISAAPAARPTAAVGEPMPATPTAANMKDGVVYATNRGPAKWNAATGKFTPITP